MNAPDFHCHSRFSVLDGMGSEIDVVKRAKELKWSGVCLTEHGTLGSAPLFYKAARAENLNPVIGCEFYVCPDDQLGIREKEFRWNHFHLTVLALSLEGYRNLVRWSTLSQQRENFYDRPRISLQAMAEHAVHPLYHNVVLSGCLASELCVTLQNANGNGMSTASAYVEAVKSLFPNFYIEVQNHRKENFLGVGFQEYESMLAREEQVRKSLLELAKISGTRVVLTNDSHFQRPSQREGHLVMLAEKRSRAPGRVKIEEHYPAYSYVSNFMQSMEEIAANTSDLPDDTLDNALEIVDEANILFDPLDRFSYSVPISGYPDPTRRIRRRAEPRLRKLRRLHGEAVDERFEHELATLGDFSHYLLIISDLVIHAKKSGILVNTRGSAANSLVCYCLRIHDVDPMPDAYNLLFSRFVNPARKKLPDIDLDIERDRFDDFMSYAKEYMAEREGEGQVVQICNYGTLANRSSFRMVADALGISKEEQDEITKLLPQIIDSGMVDEENDVYEALKEEYPEIYELASTVFHQIKNVSQHACGWLVGTRDRPIQDWVPLCLIASSNSLVTQFDLKALDDMGLVKFDFLRLKTLSVIQRTRRMLGQDANDITDIPLDDAKTFQMLREGRTEGVFTLQGRENRKGVIETEVEDVHDVIKAVAIYRPALTREGKHNTYNNRRKGNSKVSYSHPIAEEILSPTFGVPVFQEQAMELAYAVGMSDSEVDEIYQAIKKAKGVGKGAKEAFEEIEPKFFKRALEVMDEERAEAYWKDIQGFQGYGFNKGHATSYGLLAVRSAYLKCHYPAQFYTALLDVYPEKSRYVASARAEGFPLAPPDVNTSGLGFSWDQGNGCIRVGLSRIKRLGPVAAREILAGQPYSSYEDFRSRVSRRAVNVARVEALAAVGALASLGIAKSGGDIEEFRFLGFTLRKPQALRGLRPRNASRRVSESGWSHLGLEHSVDFTPPRASVSKLFWIPPGEQKEIYSLKASAYAHVKTHLLQAVDENGIVFTLMANEDRKGDVKIVKFLATYCRGAAVCVDGSIRQPMLLDGPLGFRISGVTGAYQDDPQIWHLPKKEKEIKLVLTRLQRERTRANADGSES